MILNTCGLGSRSFACALLARSFQQNSWQPRLLLARTSTCSLRMPETASLTIGPWNGSREPSSTIEPCQRSSTANQADGRLPHATFQRGCRNPAAAVCACSSKSCALAVEGCPCFFWLRASQWLFPWTTGTAGICPYHDIRP